MKYWEIIRVDGKPSTLNNKKYYTNNTRIDIDSMSDDIKQILECVKNNPTTVVQQIPSDSTSLTEDKVNNVMTWLLDYQERYFADIPLPDSLDKNFVWNIPKKIYDCAEKNRLLEQPDVLNPLFWFYCMLLDEPEDMISKFILNAVNAITDEDESIIEKQADVYDYNYGIYEDDQEYKTIDD